jgi:hypothetical protein
MSKIFKDKKIYAVVISYNSYPVLDKLYKRINKNIFDKIYFIDDNSTDGSAEKAKKYSWKIIRNKKNLGHGGNLKKGLNIAFKAGADYVVEIHADNQYNPNSILKAKNLLSKNYDLIIGSRFVNKNPWIKDGMPFMRYATNKSLTLITNFFLKKKLSEFHTGYKIFSRKFYNILPLKYNSNNYLFSFEIILQAAFFNLKYEEISIASSYKGYHTSCNYFNGFLYIIGNFKVMIYFLLARFARIKINLFQRFKNG